MAARCFASASLLAAMAAAFFQALSSSICFFEHLVCLLSVTTQPGCASALDERVLTGILEGTQTQREKECGERVQKRGLSVPTR